MKFNADGIKYYEPLTQDPKAPSKWDHDANNNTSGLNLASIKFHDKVTNGDLPETVIECEQINNTKIAGSDTFTISGYPD